MDVVISPGSKDDLDYDWTKHDGVNSTTDGYYQHRIDDGYFTIDRIPEGFKNDVLTRIKGYFTVSRTESYLVDFIHNDEHWIKIFDRNQAPFTHVRI